MLLETRFGMPTCHCLSQNEIRVLSAPYSSLPTGEIWLCVNRNEHSKHGKMASLANDSKDRLSEDGCLIHWHFSGAPLSF